METCSSHPIVLDTDIGTDIDDVYALILAAASAELRLLAVTTVNSDVVLRARLAVRILRLLGRPEIPVAAGRGEALTPGVTRGWLGHEGAGADLSGIAPCDLSALSASELIAATADRCHAEGRPLTLVTIGPLTNAALFVRQFPDQASKLRGIVAMASTFAGFGRENARGEHNVACDPDAAAVVLEAPIPLTLVGLNVTQQTGLSLERVQGWETLGSALAREVAAMHRLWFRAIGRDVSPMHDPLAVATVAAETLCEWSGFMSPGLADGGERGAIVYNPPAEGEVTPRRIATAVDLSAFDSFFFSRIGAALETGVAGRGFGHGGGVGSAQKSG